VTLVYGQMNEPPGARARVALTGARALPPWPAPQQQQQQQQQQEMHQVHELASSNTPSFYSHARACSCSSKGPVTKIPHQLCATIQPLLPGLTVAEYFRDVEGQDVLLFVDNIFRFTQAS